MEALTAYRTLDGTIFTGYTAARAHARAATYSALSACAALIGNNTNHHDRIKAIGDNIAAFEHVAACMRDEELAPEEEE